MPKDYSPEPSTATPSMSADESWAVEWLANRMKPSRQQNLTPSQRKQQADLLRALRNRPSDVEWSGQRE